VSLFGGSSDSCLYEQTGSKSSAVTGESTSPGEDPTGASAEREGEGGFDPQSEGRRARGEYKGARGVLGAGTTRPHRPAAGRGAARGAGGRYGSNGRPNRVAELYVACALLMAHDT
jgi:hypothetical protein